MKQYRFLMLVFFVCLLAWIVGINHCMGQQLKQIQPGTTQNLIPVTNGKQFTQVYRDAKTYILDTLSIRDTIMALSMLSDSCCTDSIYIVGNTIKLRDGSGEVLLPQAPCPILYAYEDENAICGSLGIQEGDNNCLELYWFDGNIWTLISKTCPEPRIFSEIDTSDVIDPIYGDIIVYGSETDKTYIYSDKWEVLDHDNNPKNEGELIFGPISTRQADIRTSTNNLKQLRLIAADSTVFVAHHSTNTIGIKVDTNRIATQYDLTQITSADNQKIDTFQIVSNKLRVSNQRDAERYKEVDLAPYLDNTDSQNLSLLDSVNRVFRVQISGGNTIKFKDTDTDLQKVDVFSITSNTLNLSLERDGEATKTISLAPYLDNTDNQDLSLSSNVLSLTNDATTVNLAPYLDNTDSQNLSLLDSVNRVFRLQIAGGNTVKFKDTDTDTDLQKVDQFNITSNTLSLSVERDGEAPKTVSLAPYLDNTDNQDLTLSSNVLSLTNDATTVNLAPYLDNTDNQDLTLSSNVLSLTNDATTVNLAPYLDNTDNQNLSLLDSVNRVFRVQIANGNIIKFKDTDTDTDLQKIDQFNITSNTLNLSVERDGEAPKTVNLAPYLDNTDNQDLTLLSNVLSLTNDATTVNLAPYLDNTDNQDLSLSSNVLSLTNDATTVNLAPYLDNTDNQTLSISGGKGRISITGGNTVVLSDTLTNNEGTLGVGAGSGSNDAKILSNTVGANGVTLNGSTYVNVNESTTSSDGGIILFTINPQAVDSTRLAPNSVKGSELEDIVAPGTGFNKFNLDANGRVTSAMIESYLTTETGDISSVVANAPLTGGGTSGAINIGIDTSETNMKAGATQFDLRSYVPTTRTISTTAPLSGGGDLSANRTLSIATANTSTTGALSSTDWNTFNGKVGGSGVSDKLAIWNGTGTLTNNTNLHYNASLGNLGIGTASPSARLHVDNGDFFVIGGSNRRFLMGSSVSQGFWGGMQWNTSNNLDINHSGFISGPVQTMTSNGFTGFRNNTSPIAPIDVYSENTSNNGLYQRWAYAALPTGPTNYNLVLKQTVTSGNVRFNFSQVNNGTTYNDVLVFDRGNIGIGTTDASQKLHVNGNARITALAGTGTRVVGATTDGDLTTVTVTGTNWFNNGSPNNDISNIGATGTKNSGRKLLIGQLTNTGIVQRHVDFNCDFRLRGKFYDKDDFLGTATDVLRSNATGEVFWGAPPVPSTVGTTIGIDDPTPNPTSTHAEIKLYNNSASGLGAGVTITGAGGITVSQNATANSNGGTISIAATDASITNEGFLGVGSGGANSANLNGHNNTGTQVGSSVVINGGSGVAITETSTGVNGGQINIAMAQAWAQAYGNTTVQTVAQSTTGTYNIQNSVNNYTSNYTVSTANDDVTILTAGQYEVNVNLSTIAPSGGTLMIEYWDGSFWLNFPNNTNLMYIPTSTTQFSVSNTVIGTLAANQKIRLRITNNSSTNTLDYYRGSINIKKLN